MLRRILVSDRSQDLMATTKKMDPHYRLIRENVTLAIDVWEEADISILGFYLLLSC
jgi:hypothetical protein